MISLRRKLRNGRVGALSIAAAALVFAAAAPGARAQQPVDFGFLPEGPVSEFLPVAENGPDHGFCSRWDPEYGYRGKACCERVPVFRRASAARCSPQRIKWNFCDEMTPEQREYIARAKAGTLGNWWESRASFQQSESFCGVSQGFLVYGRPLVETPENRVVLRNPNRCTNFGTDGMVGALDWLGREISREYSDAKHAGIGLNVGDLSAPRGGCISGRRGRRGHASHTTGHDADIGFLNTRAGVREVNAFTAQFDAAANWWLLKRLFANPYACVKKVFLDKRLIRKLGKVAAQDPEWAKIAPHVQHIRGHRSHFHVRVGDGPGAPGCPHLRDPNLEFDPGDEEDPENSDSPDSPENAMASPVMEVDASQDWSVPSAGAGSTGDLAVAAAAPAAPLAMKPVAAPAAPPATPVTSETISVSAAAPSRAKSRSSRVSSRVSSRASSRSSSRGSSRSSGARASR